MTAPVTEARELARSLPARSEPEPEGLSDLFATGLWHARQIGESPGEGEHAIGAGGADLAEIDGALDPGHAAGHGGKEGQLQRARWQAAVERRIDRLPPR